MRIRIEVEIYPVVGQVYKFQGRDFQCSRINTDAKEIEIISADTSEPRLVSYGKFFMLFGMSSGL